MEQVKIEQICPNCGKKFIIECSKSLFNRGKYRKFCSRSCANKRYHSDETKLKTSLSLKKFYETHELLKGCKKEYTVYSCKNCGKQFTIKDIRNTTGRQYCSCECRSAWLKQNAKWGGHREGSGHGKSGWYKGIYCSSTWELAYLIYCLDHNIDIVRCKEIRSYTYEGKTYKYYPDFVVNGQIIEIKGYLTKRWEAKRKYNPDVKVLYKNDILPYIQYVHDKYTNVLTELYDESKPLNDIENRKYFWVHLGNKQTMIKPEVLDEYLSNGWIKGRLRNKY